MSSNRAGSAAGPSNASAGPLKLEVRRLVSSTWGAHRTSQTHRECEHDSAPECRDQTWVTASSPPPRPIHMHRRARAERREDEAELREEGNRAKQRVRKDPARDEASKCPDDEEADGRK